ncbi:Dimethyl sulfoxide/trimethylamine N-oxide reductase precursor [Serratia fonticola]|uniref:Dimethyl sulfoxide/trimethylamine N-oxide reductase n=1 Tax=Serratia fonticola TaxID=47917 RepID=A0A4U9UP86_SERFO|nr:Dimethyl sulfoxide/trimethylamine N-oxide reductase precursor [Serratia fonticola]
MVGVLPVKDDPYPNDLITMAPHQVHAENRIKYPMVRKSWLEGGPGSRTELRGNDEWVRVSWEKAIDLVGNEIVRLQKDHGPAVNLCRFLRLEKRGYAAQQPYPAAAPDEPERWLPCYAGDYSTGAAQVIMSHVMGSMEVYEQQTAWPNVIDNSQLVILWGCNPMVTLKNSWNVPDHVGQTGFEALKKKGTRIISIDPVHSDSAKYVGATVGSLRVRTPTAPMLIGIAPHPVDRKAA